MRFLVAAAAVAYSAAAVAQTPMPKKTGPYHPKGLDRSVITDARVLEAMSKVPRHVFVPEEYRERAYDDSALPIEEGQTISQPFIVALMTQEAKVRRGAKILEIGTGSGYQAAVLAELGAEVYTIEIIPNLAEAARIRLEELGYTKVQIRQGDGWLGWPEAAPFDAILVTAASPKEPAVLLEQLKDGGRLIIPMEEVGIMGGEELIAFQRTGKEFRRTTLGGVRFVPLQGRARE